jgi:hypothetical protein
MQINPLNIHKKKYILEQNHKQGKVYLDS